MYEYPGWRPVHTLVSGEDGAIRGADLHFS